MNKIIQVNKDNEVIINESNSYEINITNESEINIIVEDNMNANLYIHSNEDNLNIIIKYILKDNSYLKVSKFYNNEKTNERTIINLDGKNSKLDYYFSSITVKDDLYHIDIHHNNDSTISNIINRAITVENAKVLFDVNSYLPKNVKGAIINQDSRVITTNNNESIIKPNMYIDNHNTEARHSSVVGSFNDEELFYLMSRGIDYKTSIKLLVKGFILSKLDIDITKREQILKIINKYWR